jgi:hypothetical protein
LPQSMPFRWDAQFSYSVVAAGLKVTSFNEQRRHF